jgi:hypothetical protein
VLQQARGQLQLLLLFRSVHLTPGQQQAHWAGSQRSSIQTAVSRTSSSSSQLTSLQQQVQPDLGLAVKQLPVALQLQQLRALMQALFRP